MWKAFGIVVAIGGGIGLMIPLDRPPPAVAQAEVDDDYKPGEGASPSPQTSPTGPSGPHRETRLVRRGNGHFYVNALVNGQVVEFIVDTGATGVALTEADARRVGFDVDRNSFQVIGTGASGAVRGQQFMLDSVEVEGKYVADVQGAVLEGSEISLLGQSYLSRITSVTMSGEYMTLR